MRVPWHENTTGSEGAFSVAVSSTLQGGVYLLSKYALRADVQAIGLAV